MARELESTLPEEPSLKLEQWPCIATQRMQRRTHLFKGHGNEHITALTSVNSSNFLSSCDDGTVRAWSPSTGKELIRMDGFECMWEFVCVHDFDVEASEVQDGYELEW